MKLGALFRGDVCAVPRVWRADRWGTRLRGLLGRPALAPAAAEGLLLSPCASVHTLGMGYALDIVFLAADGTVLSWRHDVEPWRGCGQAGARETLELHGGSLDTLRPRRGEVLRWQASPQSAPTPSFEFYRRAS